MERKIVNGRKHWKEEVEELGFFFHTENNIKYWEEGICYVFNDAEVELIKKFSHDINELVHIAVDEVIRNNWFYKLDIPERFVDFIIDSWKLNIPSIYTRFDFSLCNSKPKLYEVEGDVPISLFESSIVQANWLDFNAPNTNQFNYVNNALIDNWKNLMINGLKKVHFTSFKNLEDFSNVRYLMDTATTAGLDTHFLWINEIGWDFSKQEFVDNYGNRIDTIFKLYPWRWLFKEPFADFFILSNNKWIEPAWKLICSNKGFLAVLWEIFPNHPYLLPAYFPDDRNKIKGKIVKKHLHSSYGTDTTIYENNKLDSIVEHRSGKLENEKFVFQEFYSLPKFSDKYALISSWLINNKCVGIGIRESDTLITDITARFVPHYIKNSP